MALQALGNPISASQIRSEFGATSGTSVSFGAYRVSQTVSGLTDMPLDAGIPKSGQIKFSDFYSKRLNVVVDETQPVVEFTSLGPNSSNFTRSLSSPFGNATSNWSDFMKTYAVWVQPGNMALDSPQGSVWTINVPITQNYLLELQADTYAFLEIDGNRQLEYNREALQHYYDQDGNYNFLLSLPANKSRAFILPFTAGTHRLYCEVINIPIPEYKLNILGYNVNTWDNNPAGVAWRLTGMNSRVNAKSDYDANNSKVKVIGGFRARPDSPEGTKVWIHTNGSIGSDIIGTTVNNIKYCSLLTGSWHDTTDLIVDIGPNGRVFGAGGDGGKGGNANRQNTWTDIKSGGIGGNGTSAIGVIPTKSTTINIRTGAIISGGGGGGGGGGGATSRTQLPGKDDNSACGGGGGGGGAGFPGGNGGAGGVAVQTEHGIFIPGDGGADGTTLFGGKGGNGKYTDFGGVCSSGGGGGGVELQPGPISGFSSYDNGFGVPQCVAQNCHYDEDGNYICEPNGCTYCSPSESGTVPLIGGNGTGATVNWYFWDQTGDPGCRSVGGNRLSWEINNPGNNYLSGDSVTFSAGSYGTVYITVGTGARGGSSGLNPPTQEHGGGAIPTGGGPGADGTGSCSGKAGCRGVLATAGAHGGANGYSIIVNSSSGSVTINNSGTLAGSVVYNTEPA
mgnify:CR=1 FL=1